jgi:DNA-binding NarL/FixJ family response regulator
MIRILVADDHPVVRDGLVAILSTQPDFDVVGEAGTGRDTIAEVARLAPDVLLLDLEMPDMDGLTALQQIRGAPNPPQVLVFTAFDSDERIITAIKSGVKGYLLKGSPREELFRAIRAVAKGESLLHPRAAASLMRRVTEPEPESLTERELEVLRLVGKGLANKAIARELVITERTVKFHVSAILGKLDVGNRTEAVRVAVQRGLIVLS